ncbi:phosphatase PAP2 family protein [Candidatus Pacearchaeota archaeon]|nr:phosphatase PAP2 family protein [Candidatus Pacearchaeota archaeon]
MKKSEKILLAISAISLVLFLLVLVNLYQNSALKLIDLKINSAITTIQIQSLIEISKVAGIIIDPEPMIIFGLILSVLVWFIYSKKESALLFFSMLFSGGLILMIKETLKIARPENSLIQNTFLSFPSGHTTITIVLLGIFCYWILKSKRKRFYKSLVLIASALITLIVGFSRIYLNAHWFSDVLAGLFLGTFILTTILLIKIILGKNKREKI